MGYGYDNGVCMSLKCYGYGVELFVVWECYGVWD